MKMLTTARHSFEANENDKRIKNELNQANRSELNSNLFLKKRLHTQLNSKRLSSSDEVIKVKREHQDQEEIFEQSHKSDEEGGKGEEQKTQLEARKTRADLKEEHKARLMG